MSVSKTVNKGWVKLSLPKMTSENKVRTKSQAGFVLNFQLVKNILSLDQP